MKHIITILKPNYTLQQSCRLSTLLRVDNETGIISRGSQDLFQTIIGMEIHAQLDISTKLFSPAPRTFSRVPNSHVHPMDLGVPGFLPVLSQEAVHAALLTAAACRCDIASVSRFERKHYFYRDLPLGYQITQQRWPLARNGSLRVNRTLNNKKKKSPDDVLTVGIDRIQLEQDTGKTTTISSGTTTTSLVDFDRAGCALVEIVFSPDIRSSTDAAAVVSTLRDLLKHIGTCDGRMEEGSLRCDLNVSIAPLEVKEHHVLVDTDNPYQLPPGTGNRVEVKNLNSLHQVRMAADYEAQRQAQSALADLPTQRETRTFDPKSGTTITTRAKEGAVDYRFLPEPDVPPLVLNEMMLNGLNVSEFIAKHMPELPEETLQRLIQDYGLSHGVARVITGDPPAIVLFEQAFEVAEASLSTKSIPKLAKTVANWLCNDLFGLVKEHAQDEDASVQQSTVSSQQLGELIVLLEQGLISTPLGKKILTTMYEEELGKSPRVIAEERGWKVISDMQQLRDICRRVIAENEDQLTQFKQGGKHVRKVTKFFVGKAMAASKGNAHPELLQDALIDVLEEVAPGISE